MPFTDTRSNKNICLRQFGFIEILLCLKFNIYLLKTNFHQFDLIFQYGISFLFDFFKFNRSKKSNFEIFQLKNFLSIIIKFKQLGKYSTMQVKITASNTDMFRNKLWILYTEHPFIATKFSARRHPNRYFLTQVHI